MLEGRVDTHDDFDELVDDLKEYTKEGKRKLGGLEGKVNLPDNFNN